jgi:hypothetical protein
MSKNLLIGLISSSIVLTGTALFSYYNRDYVKEKYNSVFKKDHKNDQEFANKESKLVSENVEEECITSDEVTEAKTSEETDYQKNQEENQEL